MSYLDVLRTIGLPDNAVRLARGDFKADQSITMKTPFQTTGFSPALAPIYSIQYPWLVGCWVDPFQESFTFVEVVPEDDYRAREVFLSFPQLAASLVLKDIADDGEVSNSVRRLAVDLGFSEQAFEILAAHALKRGDRPRHLAELPVFADRPPWSVSPERYRGAWPHGGRALDDAELVRVSGLELTPAQLAEVRGRQACPPWLASDRQPRVFERLLADGDLDSAWRCLNSPGWLFAEVRVALGALAVRAGRPWLSALADAWREQPHEQFGGYGTDESPAAAVST
jgi:hypothetical protein